MKMSSLEFETFSSKSINPNNYFKTYSTNNYSMLLLHFLFLIILLSNPIISLKLISTNKPTWQSSTYENQISELAVRKYYGNDLQKGETCTQTLFNGGYPYWIVDLEENYNIDNVVIYNRMDCCSERILGVQVEVLDVEQKLICQCGIIDQTLPFYIMKCNSCPGRMVRIRHTKSTYLTLCNVSVYGGRLNYF